MNTGPTNKFQMDMKTQQRTLQKIQTCHQSHVDNPKYSQMEIWFRVGLGVDGKHPQIEHGGSL